MEYYVYAHLNPATNDVFYIGKGKGERDQSTDGRNKFWQNYVAKYGLKVSRLVDGISDLDALRIEADYIRYFGLRRDGGKLVNLTYGGRGGKTIGDHNRDSVSAKCRGSKLGSKNPNFGKKTWLSYTQMPQEMKDKISLSRTGQKLSESARPKVLEGLRKAAIKSLESRTHKVRCLKTGKVWNNRHECCKELEINIPAFKNRIRYNKETKGYYLQLFK